MSLSENKGLWLSVAILVVVAGVIVWMVTTAEPFNLVVLFDDVGDLKVGDPVVWKNFKIGRVERIRPLVDNQVGVTVRIKEDYVSSITRGSEFILKRASFLGLIGDNAIEVATPASHGEPYSNGEKIAGKNLPKTSAIETGAKRTLEYLQRMRDDASRMLQEFQGSPFRRDLEEALDEIRILAEKGARQAKSGLEQFRKDHQQELDSVLRKLERLRDEMRKRGDEKSARRVEEEMDRIKLPAEAPPASQPRPHH